MVEAKNFVICVVVVLSVSRELGIRANPSNSSTIDDGLCSELEEELESQVVATMRLQRLESEQKVENIRLRHMLRNKDRKIKMLENKRSRLTTISALGNERRRRLSTTQALQNERTTRGPQGARPVTATLISILNHGSEPRGITKVEDKIYVLQSNGYYRISIDVHEDLIGFPFLRNIPLSGITFPGAIVYSNATKCVYIGDLNQGNNFIWVMTITREHQLTRWLKVANADGATGFSLTKEGHLLVKGERQSSSPSSLEIYSLNGTLVRRLPLPQDIYLFLHNVVETWDGNFIVTHPISNSLSGPWAISQLTNDGQLINRYTMGQSDKEFCPYSLFLDSDKNRLFVADYYNSRVILFDSRTLTWSQVLVSHEKNLDRLPFSLFFDASKKHLFVGEYQANVTVYEIN